MYHFSQLEWLLRQKSWQKTSDHSPSIPSILVGFSELPNTTGFLFFNLTIHHYKDTGVFTKQFLSLAKKSHQTFPSTPSMSPLRTVPSRRPAWKVLVSGLQVAVRYQWYLFKQYIWSPTTLRLLSALKLKFNKDLHPQLKQWNHSDAWHPCLGDLNSRLCFKLCPLQERHYGVTNNYTQDDSAFHISPYSHILERYRYTRETQGSEVKIPGFKLAIKEKWSGFIYGIYLTISSYNEVCINE